MEITEEEDGSGLQSFPDHVFHRVHFWEKLLRRRDPLTVQVVLRVGRASVVAYHHSVRVKHRHYLEDKFVSK